MAESTIPFTPGTGGKAHSYQRTIGANAVDESVVILGEPYLPTYSASATAISAATAAAHVMQLMAGSSLGLAVRRVLVRQTGLATNAGVCRVSFVRLTTAGTGGSAVTPAPYDLGDNPSGATAQTLPSSKGTEGDVLYNDILGSVAVNPSTSQNSVLWEARPDMKGLVIPSGTANGLALKVSGLAGVTVDIDIEFVERSFL